MSLLQTKMAFTPENEIGQMLPRKASLVGANVFSEEAPSATPAPEQGTVSKIGSALISSEKGFGEDIAAASTAVLPESVTGVGDVKQGLSEMANDSVKLAQLIRERKAKGWDTTALETGLKNEMETMKNLPGVDELFPALKKTNWQVVGDAAGVALDILSAGSYGSAAKGATAGKLLTSAEKAAIKGTGEAVASNIVESSIKPTLSTAVKTIGKETAARAAVGAGVGYTADVIENVKEGKTGTEALTPGMGTVTGGVLPVLIGGVRAGTAIGKEQAPRIINSLVKPKASTFAYGQNPGRTVSEMGITGNSIPDFEKNLVTAKDDVGRQIGEVYSNPKNSKLIIDANDDIDRLNKAITKAAKGGKNNQAIVDQLVNVRDSLLFEQVIDENGKIANKGNMARNFSKLTPQEGQDLIQEVASHTRFTGNPSDDKLVNATLQDVYRGIREKLNDAVSKNNPDIIKLNEKYGDLTSAVLAVRNRANLIQRSDLVSQGIKTGAGAAAGIIATVLSGGTAIPVILAGVAGAGLEKALETTAVKTRIASWLAKASPKAIKTLTSKNPNLVPILLRIAPNLASKM